jgi:hypothetical protein
MLEGKGSALFFIEAALAPDLYTENMTVKRQSAKTALPLPYPKSINQSRRKQLEINYLQYCLKFDQNAQTPPMTDIRSGSAQIFNTLIHRFRGYAELRWQLNYLTIG